jgi:hypothetical protein
MTLASIEAPRPSPSPVAVCEATFTKLLMLQQSRVSEGFVQGNSESFPRSGNESTKKATFVSSRTAGHSSNETSVPERFEAFNAAPDISAIVPRVPLTSVTLRVT